MKYTCLLFLFLLLRFSGYSQSYKLSPDPVQFVTDLKAMMAATKNEGALQSGNALEIAWNSGMISAKQKEQVIGVAQKMMKKKMRPRPQFEHLCNTVAGAVNEQKLTGAGLDQLLLVVDKALDQDDPKAFERFLAASALFLKEKKLFSSNHSRVRAVGGTFSFAYSESKAGAGDTGWGNQDKDKGQPAPKDDWGVWEKQAEPADDGWGTATGPVKSKNPAPASVIPAYAPEPQPPVTGPTLVLKDVDLVLVTPYDSVTILKTEGSLMLTRGLWVGEKGTFGWTIKNAPVKAELKAYHLEVAKVGFRAEPVTLDYPAMLEAPIEGVLEFRSKKKNPNGESDFPRFISLTNNARVKNIGTNIGYVGGFSLAGPKVMSAALDESPSVLTVSLNGEKKFTASARNYEMSDTLITSRRAAIVILQQTDSITHPALQFKYVKPRQELTLVRDNGRFRNTPFYDSYHKLEIVSELVVWDLTSPLLNFGMLNAKDQIPARFESKENYNDAKYQQLKGINSFHPLKMVVAHAQKKKTDEFYADDLARENKIKEAPVRAAMAHLESEGYIEYDPQTSYLKLRDKAHHYVISSLGKKDYDHLVLNSVSSAGKNATLNLQNNELLVRGIDKFYFSADSNSVYVQPDSGIVRVLKNRDLRFNGKVYSGNFIFKGQDFLFDYDGFYIDLAKIDSTIFMVNKGKKLKKGEKPPADIALMNKMKSGNGKLYLNKPDNKSGKVKNLGYPKYDAQSGVYVYFNKPNVLGGAYDTSVYFSIPPFTVDSMTTSRQGTIGFNGQFHSGGIFPPFETKLVQMPDNSLGFNYPVPKNGFKAYGGKGDFYQTITLNSQGLRGKGEIKYLTATLQSDDFVFYLDSVRTDKGVSVRVGEGNAGDGSFPQATLEKYKLNWKPKVDSMYLWAEAQPLKLYQEKYTFQGVATITPSGIYGNGKTDGAEVRMNSPAFLFQQKEIKGNKTELAIKSKNPNKPALTTTGVTLTMDLEKGVADYVPEQEGVANTELPYVRYTTSLSAGRWDMNKKVVTLLEPKIQSKSRAYFYATHPDQDSLQFQASTGVYDLNRFTLIAAGVPHIAVGDAYVIPDSNKVSIAENGNMRKFQNATILMDTLNKFHRLYQGDIQVTSRKALSGTAQYDFKNAAAQTFPIKFGSFTPTETQQGKKEKAASYTKAIGTVSDKSEFFISPSVRYYGEVAMASNKEQLDFDGYVKVGLSKSASSDWFPFAATVDPDEVRFKIDKPLAPDGMPLATGLHMALSDGSAYSTFISKKKHQEDPDIFTVTGWLSYDKAKKAFKIGDEAKAYGDALQGNLMYFNDSLSTLEFSGKFNLIEPNKNFVLESSGLGTARLDSGRYSLNTMMAFDLNIPEQAWAAMGDRLADNTSGAPDAIDGSSTLHYKLAEFIGDKGVQDYIRSASGGYVPLNKVSSKLARNLLLTDVDLRWSPKTKSWYSVGKIGIAGISKKDVNAKVDGHIEIKKGVHGDVVVMYLEARPSVWYYFSFNEGALALASTDNNFDKVISSKSKGDNTTTTNYTFFLAEPMERMQFVNYFRKTYLNLEPLKEAPIVVRQEEAGSSFDFAEESDGKKKKKGKKGAFPEMEHSGQGTPTPSWDDEPPVEKSAKGKKRKNDVDTGDGGVAAPAEVAEQPAKGKEKKKKGKKEAEPDVDW